MRYQRCPICDKEFKTYPSENRHYCSMMCLREGFKTQFRGENNPNYRHGPKHCEVCGVEISRNAQARCTVCSKIGEANPFFGKTHCDATKEHFSEIRKGKDLGHSKGRKYSEEHKRAMSERQKARWQTLTAEERMVYTDSLMRGIQTQQSFKETKPEQTIRESLEGNGIAFEKNKLLYDKFLVDFYVGDGSKIVEVFGDYWHCNPKVFQEPNDHQKKQMIKDKSRLAYLTKCGHEVIVVWEHDLKTRQEEIVADLIERLK